MAFCVGLFHDAGRWEVVVVREGQQLRVRVNAELVLDAGTCEVVAGPRGQELLVHPPRTTLFRQVLAYLEEKPDPPKPPYGSFIGREGVAGAALCLRWGSYLAVLLDRDKPIWSLAVDAATSRVGDGEMARVNIEASAALAEWIDFHGGDPWAPPYARLVNRAVAYLPMPKKTTKVAVGKFAALADPTFASRFVQANRAERVARVRADAERHPTRVLANALVNTAWRNGPIEDIHAGQFAGFPLDRRRVTPTEERELMRFTSGRLALGMAVCEQLARERPRRPWPEQVLPYGLADWMLITPSRWTLTEASREVRFSLATAPDSP